MQRPPARFYRVLPDEVPPAGNPPAPAPMPTLTITAKGVLHLHAALRQTLGMKHGQPINLVPPSWNSLYWHLDLRPCATCRVSWNDDTSVRAYGINLPPALVTQALTLHLLPGIPAYPHYYPLLPTNAFDPK